MYRCLLCGDNSSSSLTILAYHVRSHSKQAKEAYKRGYWKIKMSEPNMFDAIDKPIDIPAQEAVGQDSAAVEAKGDATAALVGSPSPSIVKVIGELEPASFIEPKADLIYGATGSGKTVNIGEVSDYVLQRWGKLTRMVSADGGGFGPLGGLVKAGQIEYWAIGAWKYPVAALHKAVRGYWPLRLDDPESPLVPPDAGTWEVYGFGAFEGLTSFGDMMLANLKEEKASLSQDPSYTWTQDGVDFSGGNMSYYGFMQDNLQREVAISHLLKYEKVLWTGQESKGDDQGGSKVYGPMIGGKKATGKAGGWFLNVFHMDIIAGESKKDVATGQLLTEAKHVLFIKTHIDPLTMIPFPCKIRAPKAYVSEVPNYLQSGSVADAYRLLDSLYAKQETQSVSKLNEISGLKERLMERAIAAKKAEVENMEKRAKAAKLLKPIISVPATTGVVNTTKVPGQPGTNGATQLPNGAGIEGGAVTGKGAASSLPSSLSLPKKPVGPVSIQPVGKK